jgi:hypothetical protein
VKFTLPVAAGGFLRGCAAAEVASDSQALSIRSFPIRCLIFSTLSECFGVDAAWGRLSRSAILDFWTCSPAWRGSYSFCVNRDTVDKPYVNQINAHWQLLSCTQSRVGGEITHRHITIWIRGCPIAEVYVLSCNHRCHNKKEAVIMQRGAPGPRVIYIS